MSFTNYAATLGKRKLVPLGRVLRFVYRWHVAEAEISAACFVLGRAPTICSTITSDDVILTTETQGGENTRPRLVFSYPGLSDVTLAGY